MLNRSLKPFREFKCKEHGYGWLKRCSGCVLMNDEFYNYYGLKIISLKEHDGNYLFPLCRICKMRYVHNMSHTAVSSEVWAKEWEKILVK